jgi:hypothetical protein
LDVVISVAELVENEIVLLLSGLELPIELTQALVTLSLTFLDDEVASLKSIQNRIRSVFVIVLKNEVSRLTRQSFILTGTLSKCSTKTSVTIRESRELLLFGLESCFGLGFTFGTVEVPSSVTSFQTGEILVQLEIAGTLGWWKKNWADVLRVRNVSDFCDVLTNESIQELLSLLLTTMMPGWRTHLDEVLELLCDGSLGFSSSTNGGLDSILIVIDSEVLRGWEIEKTIEEVSMMSLSLKQVEH